MKDDFINALEKLIGEVRLGEDAPGSALLAQQMIRFNYHGRKIDDLQRKKSSKCDELWPVMLEFNNKIATILQEE